MTERVHFLEADEEIADEENILAPIDVYLYFEMIELIRKKDEWNHTGEEIQEMVDRFLVSWERTENAILRLCNNQFLDQNIVGQKPENREINVRGEAFSRMGIYSNPRNMPQEELENLLGISFLTSSGRKLARKVLSTQN